MFCKVPPRTISRPAIPPLMKFLKNLNWSNILTIAIVTVLMIGIVYPIIKPLLQKIPVIGSRFA
jgi:hypothetical protein